MNDCRWRKHGPKCVTNGMNPNEQGMLKRKLEATAKNEENRETERYRCWKQSRVRLKTIKKDENGQTKMGFGRKTIRKANERRRTIGINVQINEGKRKKRKRIAIRMSELSQSWSKRTCRVQNARTGRRPNDQECEDMSERRPRRLHEKKGKNEVDRAREQEQKQNGKVVSFQKSSVRLIVCLFHGQPSNMRMCGLDIWSKTKKKTGKKRRIRCVRPANVEKCKLRFIINLHVLSLETKLSIRE